jgi:hypothetical protein
MAGLGGDEADSQELGKNSKALKVGSMVEWGGGSSGQVINLGPAVAGRSYFSICSSCWLEIRLGRGALTPTSM